MSTIGRRDCDVAVENPCPKCGGRVYAEAPIEFGRVDYEWRSVPCSDCPATYTMQLTRNPKKDELDTFIDGLEREVRG